MEVSQTQGGTATSQTGQASTEVSEAVVSSDFETFLKMLTAQIQNQDPLNPLDSTDFATQLAQFSAVEQQVRTNDLLTALGAQMGAMSVSQLAGWVGMQASAVMPAVFDGSPIALSARPSHLADSAHLVVRDKSDTEVQRLDISTERSDLEWAGVDENGQPFPDGTYHISVESFSGEDLIESTAAVLKARIVEARNENGTPILVMDTGQEVLSSGILGLRNHE